MFPPVEICRILLYNQFFKVVVLKTPGSEGTVWNSMETRSRDWITLISWIRRKCRMNGAGVVRRGRKKFTRHFVKGGKYRRFCLPLFYLSRYIFAGAGAYVQGCVLKAGQRRAHEPQERSLFRRERESQPKGRFERERNARGKEGKGLGSIKS